VRHHSPVLADREHQKRTRPRRLDDQLLQLLHDHRQHPGRVGDDVAVARSPLPACPMAATALTVRTVIVAYIIVLGLVYHLMLRNLYNPQGWRLACVIILHYVIPPLFIIDWLAFVQKRDLSWKTLFGALALPVLYIAWTLVHGAFTGFYPYPFINVARFGYAQVLMTIGAMIAAFVGLVLGLVGIGQLSAGLALRRRDEQAEA